MVTPSGQFDHTGNYEMDQLLDNLRELSKQYETMSDELIDMRGRGEAADGLVEVEVAPGGGLLGVKIDPRAMRLGSEALGEAILQASTMASEASTKRMAELMGPLLGKVDVFNEAMEGRLPRLDTKNGITTDPQVAEALSNIERIRARYER